MSIKCGVRAKVPYPLSMSDEFQVSFDISSWLGTDIIDDVTYSAVDEDGETVTDVYDTNKSGYTSSMIKPYLKGGSTDNKRYTVKALVTTLNTYKKAFYIIFDVLENG